MRYSSPGLALIAVCALAACTSAGGGSSGASYPMAGASAGAYGAPTRQMPMDPKRSIAEQDCTKPVDADRGNLRCK